MHMNVADLLPPETFAAISASWAGLVILLTANDCLENFPAGQFLRKADKCFGIRIVN
jgi:hypothetical protein